MKKELYYCDLCGAESGDMYEKIGSLIIGNDSSASNVYLSTYCHGTQRFNPFDICPQCAAAFAKVFEERQNSRWEKKDG